ncbi:hypothetical protein BDV95DRAFT_573351 [Massariosphaeria phaeospora]|uniref:Fungal-specific transcription factor domain-containing protein n=1 Tax=Massariosphaeria phaeospora TaxID=100035 RepID=A0A7C8M7V1_9PLEO|nr:hypothetical protein BDV95DRAFT_573351 [Massariosphaeria phaeospora]
MDRSSAPSFNFINLSHPDELKDEETQLRIRRLAMAEVGKRRRKPKTRRERNEVVLEFRDPVASRIGIDRLGAGELDPFIPYPVDMDESSRSLIANVFRHNGHHSRLLRGSWWPVGISHAASFHNVLANSHLFKLREHNGHYASEDDAVSLFHYTKAVRLVSNDINDPNKNTSDELLGAVASFMCHQYILGAFAGWENHRHAMMRMIELRGGIDNVTREEFRITLSWSDLCGAFSQDIPPSIPMPRRWELDSRSPPSSPRPQSAISLAWKSQLPMRLDWISIFDDVTQLISLDRIFSDKELEGAMTSGSWMEPTMIRLLNMRPLQQGNEQENVIEEVCRLGMVLFLSPLWRHLGALPVWTFQHTQSLLEILNSNLVEWNDLKPLLLWTVYFAAIETKDPAERNQFVFMLAVLMSGMRLKQWEHLMDVVKGVLWVERVFGSSNDALREEVMGIISGVDSSVGELPVAGPSNA